MSVRAHLAARMRTIGAHDAIKSAEMLLRFVLLHPGHRLNPLCLGLARRQIAIAASYEGPMSEITMAEIADKLAKSTAEARREMIECLGQMIPDDLDLADERAVAEYLVAPANCANYSLAQIDKALPEIVDFARSRRQAEFFAFRAVVALIPLSIAFVACVESLT